jgi:hypothetical protein
VPATTLLEIPPEEQAQMRAILRRARYGYLLAFHILLLCAAGRNPTTGYTTIGCGLDQSTLICQFDFGGRILIRCGL